MTHKKPGYPAPMPVRGIRIPDQLWQDALAIATTRGDNLSAIVRDALARYVTRHTPKATP